MNEQEILAGLGEIVEEIAGVPAGERLPENLAGGRKDEHARVRRDLRSI